MAAGEDAGWRRRRSRPSRGCRGERRPALFAATWRSFSPKEGEDEDLDAGEVEVDARKGGALLEIGCVFLSCSAIVFPPVTIGEEAVIGAALVRHDVETRTVVVGSLARLLRSVRDDELLAARVRD